MKDNMIYSVEREIKEIAIEYRNNMISRENAIREVEQIARLEGEDVIEAIKYFEKLEMDF